jgi:hypothetical protein
MCENFGVVATGHDVTFRLIFPDHSADPSQYAHGGLPNVVKVQVTGIFPSKLGGVD